MECRRDLQAIVIAEYEAERFVLKVSVVFGFQDRLLFASEVLNPPVMVDCSNHESGDGRYRPAIVRSYFLDRIQILNDRNDG